MNKYSEYYKEYRLKNSKHLTEKATAWNKANPDKFKITQKKSTLKCKDKRTAYHKAYRARPEIKKHYNEYYKTKRNELKTRYTYTRNKAKNRNLEFDITFEQYVELLNKPCYYSGESLLNETGVGLDRLDNNKGYTLDNVVPCIGWVNRIRNCILTSEETMIAVKAILEYRKNKV